MPAPPQLTVGTKEFVEEMHVQILQLKEMLILQNQQIIGRRESLSTGNEEIILVKSIMISQQIEIGELQKQLAASMTSRSRVSAGWSSGC